MVTWVTPSNATSGGSILASRWNTEVGDNTQYLKDRADAAEYQGCGLYLSADQAIGLTAEWIGPYSGESWDTGGWHTPGSSFLVAPSGAIPAGANTIACSVYGFCVWEANPSSWRRLMIVVNGTMWYGNQIDAVASGNFFQNVSGQVELAAGDTVALYAQAGVSTQVLGSAGAARLSIAREGTAT